MAEWVKVPGFEYIEVTHGGRVRRCATTVMRKTRWGTDAAYNFKARELKCRLSDTGYVRVVTQHNRKRGPIYVHRLIAFAFVAGYQDGFHVNHINGKKTDNRPENLEWVPVEANSRHAWATGICDSRGEKAGAAKLTAARVRAIRRLIACGAPTNAIAVASALSSNTIWKIANGHTWQSIPME